MLAGSGSPNEATRILIDAAPEHDAQDNVSVIAIKCAEFPNDNDDEMPEEERPGKTLSMPTADVPTKFRMVPSSPFCLLSFS